MELDDRKATILRAIVEEHITTAQPVGSQTIARSRNLGVSSATVRNDMTVLEREGYLVQPHTSAGRVPTDRGYRFFVDNFDRQPGLAPAQRRVVADFFTLFQSAHQVLEELLHETSQLLARVSTHTAVVVGPHVDSRHRAQRAAGDAAALAGAGAGDPVQRSGREVRSSTWPPTSTTPPSPPPARCSTRSSSGARWNRLPELRPVAGPAADTLAGEARDALAGRAEQDVVEPLYVGGASRLAADQEAFPATDSAARLLELLERQVEVVSLVHDLLDQGDTTVRIGSENSIDELRDCSIVVAPYKVDGEVAGTVGVLGPTRMDYRQALAAVEAISQQLGDVLS